MSSRTKQLLRKGAIAGVAFITGIVGTVLAASVYDATIQSRANKILDAVKSNASQMDKSQVPAYYALVIMNIRSLIQVLDQVENGLLTNSDVALIEGLITPVSPTPGGTTGTTTTGSTVITGGTTPTPNDTRCAATTINGYSLPNAIYGQVKVIQKTISGKTYEQEFKCQENGTWLARGEEREITTSAAPSPTVCSGTEPTGNGVVKSSYFSGFVVGGSSTNTTWTYQSSFTPNTQEGSCKWKCDTGYTQSGNTCVKNTTTGSTTTTQPTSCTGNPPSGEGIVVTGWSVGDFGPAAPRTDYSYAYNPNGGKCTWTCSAGYTKGDGNTCVKKAPGTGLSIKVVDTGGKPLAGVNITLSITYLTADSTKLGPWTTDANGMIPEIFDPPTAGVAVHVLDIQKSGYTLRSATGCDNNRPTGEKYCNILKDKIQNSSIVLTLSDSSVGATGNETMKTPFICKNKTSDFIVTNVNTKATHVRGCLKPKGAIGCDTQSGFREYTPKEYTPGGSIITTVAPANVFPAGIYEGFIMYDDNKIVPVGTIYYQNCSPNGKPAATGEEKLMSTQICSNRDTSWSVIGVNPAATRVRGCAQVAGGTVCQDPNAFRDYTPQEYTPNSTSIITRIPKNTFPDGDYGSYLMYDDGKIIHVGDASYKPCSGASFGPG